MPFDGSGNFTRLYNWQSDRDNGIRILASRMDGEFDNFAGGMNVVFFRNGLVPMSGNLNMGQNYLLGLGAGSVGALPFRFADDPTTGLFLNGSGKFGIVAGGTKNLEVSASGVNLNGLLQLNGTPFVPGDYAKLSGATFTGSVAAPMHIGTSSEAFRAAANSPFYSFYNAAQSTRLGYVQHTGVNGNLILSNEQTVGIIQIGFPGTTNLILSTTGNTVNTTTTFTSAINANNGLALDPTYMFYLSADTPLVQFDTSDYIQYDRANNRIGYVIGGALVSTTTSANTSAPLFIGLGGGTGEGLRMSAASPYMTWYNPAQSTRFGYLQHTGSAGNIILTNEQNGEVQLAVPGGTQFRVVSTGIIVDGSITSSSNIFGPVHQVDNQLYLSMNNGNPYFNFDNNDFLIYDRANNQWTFNIGGVGVVGFSNAGNNFVNPVSAPRFNIDANCFINLSSGSPTIAMDANDFIQYDRTNNKYYFYIGGTAQMSLDSSGNLKVRGTITASTTP